MDNQRLIVTLNVQELKGLIREALEDFSLKSSDDKSIVEQNNELLTRIELCNLFQVSTTTIDKWRRYGLLPPEIKISSRVYFNRNEILKLLRDRKLNSNKLND